MNRFRDLLFFLTLAFAAPAFCAAASLTELGTLHTTLVGGSAVEVRSIAVSPLENEKRLEEPDRTAAVQNAFPTATKARIQALFASAHWEFRPDGTFQVTPPLEPVAELLALEGTYQRFPGAIELHTVGKLDSGGVVVSLDGILRESAGGYQVEGIYSLPMSFSTRWLAEIRQELHPGTPPPPREVPVTWIEGIPVPSKFEVTLQGKIDGRELPEASGVLSFRPSGKEHLGPVAIELDIRSLTQNGAGAGTFFWFAPPADAESEKTRITLQAGTASVEVTTRPGDSTVSWIAPGEVAFRWHENYQMNADWGRLELTVHGDEVSGELAASTASHGTMKKYLGIFKGRRTSLRSFTSLLTFAYSAPEGRERPPSNPVGSWQVEDGEGAKLGDLLLRRGGEGVIEGRLTSAGVVLSLTGSEQDGLLKLKKPGGDSLWCLRLLPGNNLLIGFEYSLEKNLPIHTLAARRTDHPIRKANASVSSIDEVEQLTARFIAGAQLASQGRCPEAIELIETILTSLHQIEEAEKSLPQAAWKAFLIMEDSATSFLVNCNLRIGDYDSFFRHLQNSVHLLKHMREAERLEVVENIESIRNLLEDLRREFLKSKIPTGLHELCRAMPPSSDESSARLANALTNASTEIDSFVDLLTVKISDLADLRARVAERRISSREGATALRTHRQELREWTEASFTRLAAANQQALRQEERLLEARNKLWTAIDLQPSRTAGDSIQSFGAAIKSEIKEGSLAARPEASLGILEVFASFFLLQLDMPLQDELDVLSYTQNLPTAVRVATELAVRPEEWRAQFVTDRGKISALERLESYFAELISLLLEAGEVGDALAVSEIARSRAFVDLLAGREEIRRRLEKLPQRAGDRTFPSPKTAAPLTLNDLLEIVRQRRSTTVEYSLTGDRLAIWVISPDGKISGGSRPVDRTALQFKIQELHRLLEGRTGERGALALPDPVRTRQLLRELHGLLIEPIPADRLPATVDEVLTIIPHQELFGVPFAALEDATGRSLIERHPLVYGTSIATLGAMRRNREGRKRTESPPRLLAMVNPSPLPRRSEGGPFPPLDKLENGFSRIAELYPAEGRLILTRQAATKTALRDHGAEADVLHLVTHAEFVEQDPLASFIALAGADGALHVPEVFRLNLSADLVVLWACETGRGGLSADGVEGLSRGFTWAGASSLLLSLWEIPDTESLIQMEGFHQFWLRQGFPKARALQKAQIEYSRLYPDQPGLWAAFVLYGEAE